MKILKYLALFLVCFALLCSSVLANTLDEIKIDAETQKVSVSGNIPAAKNAVVTVQILNPGVDEEDVKSVTVSTFRDVFSNVFQVKSDADGNFKTPEYKLSEKSGRFSVRVMWNKAGATPVLFKDAFLYVSPNFNESMLKALEESDEAGFAFVKENISLILKDDADYLLLSDEGKDNAIKRAIAESENLEDEKYTSADAFSYVLDISIMMEKMLGAEDVESADDIFVEDSAAYELQKYATPIALYRDNLDKDERCQILQKAMEKSSVTDFVNYIADNALLEAIKTVDNFAHVEEIVLSNSEWMGVKTSAYEKLKNKKTVNKALANSDAETVEEMAELFEKQVKKAKESGSVTSSGGTGGGGGSAVSGGGGISADFGGISGSTVVVDPPKEEPLPEAKMPFEDMKSFAWAEEAVSVLYENKIINGVSDVAFAPERNITREEFVKLLYAAFYGDDLSYTSDFDDVDESDWFYPYVSAATNKGLVKGVSEKEFGAGKNITRQDMTVIAYRFAKEKGIIRDDAENSDFKDFEKVADYAKEAVSKMHSAALISGTGDGYFSPDATSNRAQAAQLVYNLYKLSKGV